MVQWPGSIHPVIGEGVAKLFQLLDRRDPLPVE
jgi:hypothetical protein